MKIWKQRLNAVFLTSLLGRRRTWLRKPYLTGSIFSWRGQGSRSLQEMFGSSLCKSVTSMTLEPSYYSSLREFLILQPIPTGKIKDVFFGKRESVFMIHLCLVIISSVCENPTYRAPTDSSILEEHILYNHFSSNHLTACQRSPIF